jgi:hypothetical protein
LNTDSGTVAERESPAARKALKRQRREAHLEARRRLEESERRRRRLLWAGLGALAVVGLGLLVFWLARPETGPRAQSVVIQGQQHITRGASHPPYNTKPPTSGWHYGDAVAPWGVSTAPIPDEVQVHNLEHGGIMIQYDCPGGCPDVVAKLEEIVRSYRSKVILAPYEGIGRPIAVTAWGKIAFLDEVNEPFIRRFIAENKDKGPERVPD